MRVVTIYKAHPLYGGDCFETYVASTLYASCVRYACRGTASGKLVMAREGVFDDLDLAFMMHGSDTTTVDGKSLALNLVNIKFHGKSAHAAIAPERHQRP